MPVPREERPLNSRHAAFQAVMDRIFDRIVEATTPVDRDAFVVAISKLESSLDTALEYAGGCDIGAAIIGYADIPDALAEIRNIISRALGVHGGTTREFDAKGMERLMTMLEPFYIDAVTMQLVDKCGCREMHLIIPRDVMP